MKRLLYVARDRTEASLNGFFNILTQSTIDGIQFACTDMLPAYLKVLNLRELLKYNLKTVKAYLMREDFNHFWTYQSATWAGKFLHEWCLRARQSKIESMQKMAETLTKHESLFAQLVRISGAFFRDC